MNAKSVVLFTLMATALAVPALAQQPGATSGGAKSAPPVVAAAAVQPALAPLVAPRAAELSAAGIGKIVARTGKKRRDIQVATQYGSAYFAWPKNVTPVTFEIEVGQGGAVTVRANDYTEANRARYAAAFDAVLTESVRQANIARAYAQRPRA
jgi:hypothetical protein